MMKKEALKPNHVQNNVVTSTIPNETPDRPKINSKISDKVKKKSWYNAIYPSYKSRSESFKKLFKEVPIEERLIVDYSCALQREILMHGRLFLTQNYLCFHANIFGWETYLSLNLKDVTGITKEKTALVIPNAITITTETEKYFITSFATRNKAFLMLFRVWQNALMNTPMAPQEMWQWVHSSYGDQLGLTSDDEEDYIDPNECDEQELKENQPEDLLPEEPNEIPTHESSPSQQKKWHENDLSSGKSKLQVKPKDNDHDEDLVESDANISTDAGDSTDSDDDSRIPYICSAACTSVHDGRQLVHTILPINVDKLMALLFTKSKFLFDFHEKRKTTNMVFNDWNVNEEGVKLRTISLTVALTAAVGPKCSHVTEIQVMKECSLPGQLYSIDVTSSNNGVPYADSFCVLIHYCLVRSTDNHTKISVHAQIKYCKSVWGVVKSFIEKNTWAGLEDFFSALIRALQHDYRVPSIKSRSRRTIKRVYPTNIFTNAACSETKIVNTRDSSSSSNRSPPRIIRKPCDSSVQTRAPPVPLDTFTFYMVLLLVSMIVLNIGLIIKIWMMTNGGDSKTNSNLNPLRILADLQDDWLQNIDRHEELHMQRIKEWDKIAQLIITWLEKVSAGIKENVYYDPTDWISSQEI